jgi:hypothetical protein
VLPALAGELDSSEIWYSRQLPKPANPRRDNLPDTATRTSRPGYIIIHLRFKGVQISKKYHSISNFLKICFLNGKFRNIPAFHKPAT